MAKWQRALARYIFAVFLLLASVTQLFAAAPANQLLITFGSLSERETAIFVAKDYGLFAKNGLDVRPVHVNNGNVALSALVSGEAQFYMGAATGSTLGAIANGMDAAIIDPTDTLLMSTLLAAEAVFGRDEYCVNLIEAFQDGKLS